MRFWRWLRQFDRIAALNEALSMTVSEKRKLSEGFSEQARQMEREITRRIAAETLAGERKEECERLHAELKDVRECLKAVTDERLKSLDTLNLKLMEAKAVAEPPVDFTKIKHLENLAGQAIKNIRSLHHDMDNALLTKLHPRFQKLAEPSENIGGTGTGVVMNAAPPTD